MQVAITKLRKPLCLILVEERVVDICAVQLLQPLLLLFLRFNYLHLCVNAAPVSHRGTSPPIHKLLL